MYNWSAQVFVKSTNHSWSLISSQSHTTVVNLHINAIMDLSQIPRLNKDNILNVATIIDMPYTQLLSTKPTEIDLFCKFGKLCWKYEATGKRTRIPYCCIGYTVDLLSRLEKDMGFFANLYIVEDGFYGDVTNGTWNGLVGDLVKKHADIVIGPLSVTEKRLRVVDFSEPYLRTPVVLGTFAQTKEIPFLNVDIYKSLSIRLWILVYITIFVSSFILIISERYFNDSPKLLYHFIEILSYLFGLFFQRDIGGKNPKTFGSRVISIIIAIAMLVVVSTYIAALTANTVTHTEQLPITGFNDEKVY